MGDSERQTVRGKEAAEAVRTKQAKARRCGINRRAFRCDTRPWTENGSSTEWDRLRRVPGKAPCVLPSGLGTASGRVARSRAVDGRCATGAGASFAKNRRYIQKAGSDRGRLQLFLCRSPSTSGAARARACRREDLDRPVYSCPFEAASASVASAASSVASSEGRSAWGAAPSP